MNNEYKNIFLSLLTDCLIKSKDTLASDIVDKVILLEFTGWYINDDFARAIDKVLDSGFSTFKQEFKVVVDNI